MTRMEYRREPCGVPELTSGGGCRDAAFPWWAKVLLGVVAAAAAYVWLDKPVAAWAILNDPLTEQGDVWRVHKDPARELMMLEQYGQWVCSVIVIAVVGLVAKQGRRKALALALGCLTTVAACYLLKFAIGRTRPHMLSGVWEFMPWGGHGAAYQSFPSAHTTGAMALSAGLAWFYPRGRGLFYTLAVITAAQRVLHHAHYVSDTIAGTVLAILLVRWTLHTSLAERLLALLPATLRRWWMEEGAVGG